MHTGTHAQKVHNTIETTVKTNSSSVVKIVFYSQKHAQFFFKCFESKGQKFNTYNFNYRGQVAISQI